MLGLDSLDPQVRDNARGDIIKPSYDKQPVGGGHSPFKLTAIQLYMSMSTIPSQRASRQASPSISHSGITRPRRWPLRLVAHVVARR